VVILFSSSRIFVTSAGSFGVQLIGLFYVGLCALGPGGIVFGVLLYNAIRLLLYTPFFSATPQGCLVLRGGTM